MALILKEATFSCSFIRKGSPQQVAPHVLFGKVFTADALSDKTQRASDFILLNFYCPLRKISFGKEKKKLVRHQLWLPLKLIAI